MQVEIVLYDEITNDVPSEHRDILRKRLYDLIKYQTLGFKITQTNNLESHIKNCSSEYVLVLALGSHIGGPAVIQELVDYAIQEKTPVICHILHREGLFQLHPQCILINTAVYRKIGCPPIRPVRSEKRLLLMTPNRSRENFHDSYTPHWISPSASYEMKTVPGHFYGTYLLEELVKNGYTVKNFPDSIRYKKRYCYPNENWQEIINSLNDKDYQPKNFNVEIFIAKLKGSYEEVYSNGFYPINTEQLLPINVAERVFKQKFNFFAGVCGGVKPGFLSGAYNFQENTEVVLFDANPAALDWQRYLIENWDGDLDTLESVFNSFKLNHPNYISIIDQHSNFTDKLNFRLLEAEISKEELETRWKKFLTYKISFMKLDLLDNNSLTPLLAKLNDPQLSAYLWFSNSFNMDWQMFYLGSSYMQEKFQDTMEFIRKNTTSKIAVESCTLLYSVR